MTKAKQHKYTSEQLNFIRDNKSTERGELARVFNKKFGTQISKNAIWSVCKRRGWHTGRTGCFEKGKPSWAAGTKGVLKANKGSFKKGCVSNNKNPIGHERIHAKDGIILIKVNEPDPYTQSNTRYRAKHHVIWEEHNGPIPKGMIIRFIDNNQTNCNINNLEMISKAVHLRLNKINYAHLPLELKKTAKLQAQLEHATFSVMKDINHG